MPGASPTSPPRRRLPEPRPPPCDRSGVIPLHLHRRPVLPPRVALRAARAALVAHQRAAVVAADQRRREVAVERRDVRVVDQRLGGSREALPAPRATSSATPAPRALSSLRSSSPRGRRARCSRSLRSPRCGGCCGCRWAGRSAYSRLARTQRRPRPSRVGGVSALGRQRLRRKRFVRIDTSMVHCYGQWSRVGSYSLS